MFRYLISFHVIKVIGDGMGNIVEEFEHPFSTIRDFRNLEAKLSKQFNAKIAIIAISELNEHRYQYRQPVYASSDSNSIAPVRVIAGVVETSSTPQVGRHVLTENGIEHQIVKILDTRDGLILFLEKTYEEE